MSNASDKKVDNESENSDLQRSLEELAEKNAVTSHEIDDASSRLNTESDLFKRETEDLQTEIKRELHSFNQAIASYKKQAAEVAGQIFERAQQFSSWAEQLYNDVKKRLYVIFVLALISVAFGYFYFFNFSFSINTVLFLIFAVGMLLLVNRALSDMHKRIRKDYEQIGLHTQAAANSVGQFIVHRMGLKADPSKVNDKLTTLLSEAQRIGSAVRSYVPGLKEYYAGRNRLHRLRVFTESARNSLRNFGVSIDAKAENYLRGFGSLSDDEDEWLEKASKRLSKQLAVPQEIVSLAYYEYTNNVEGKRNEWTTIRQNDELLRRLSEILCHPKVVHVKYFGPEGVRSLGAIEDVLKKIGLFSLDMFRSIYYDFYVELARYKKDLLSTLVEYRFRVDQTIENEILEFVPDTIKRDEWVDDLLAQAAKLLYIQKNILELIFWDKIGEHGKRRKSWERILHDKTTEEFFKVILDNGVLSIADRYVGSPRVAEFVSTLLEQQPDYNLPRFTRILSGAFVRLDTYKRQLLQAISSYSLHLSEDEREEFQSLLPEKSHGKEAIIEYVQHKVKVSKKLLKLLYLDYVQHQSERRSLFYDVRKTELITELASLLIRKEIIEVREEYGDTISLLTVILRAMYDFSVQRLQLLYQKYSTLMTYSYSIANFLYVEGTTAEKVAVDFETLHEVARRRITDTTYEQLKNLFEYMIKQGGDVSWTSSLENLRAVIVAAATLFLSHQQDINARKACQEAAHLEISAKILYQYVKLTQERGLGVKAVLLREVAEGVINDEYADYALFSEFKSQLANGLLYSSLNDLLSARMEEIKRQTLKADLLKKALNRVKQAVKDFINAELQEDAVLLLLNSQLISAYLITTRSKKRVLKGVIDGTLIRLCRHLAKEDPAYRRFLLLEGEVRVAGGRWTRVGLVPPGMTFEVFSNRFQKMFTRAVNRYISSNSGVGRAQDYSVHLIRIFPSDVAFKLVKGGVETIGAGVDISHPVHVIKKLMIEKLGLISNLEIVASLRVEEPRTVAMKSVITSLVDTKTTTFLLAQQAIGPITSRHGDLQRNMKNGSFDASLISKCGCTTLSELAINVHNSCKITPPGSDNLFKKQILSSIERVVSSYKVRLTENELTLLSSAIFTMLDEFGTILSA